MSSRIPASRQIEVPGPAGRLVGVVESPDTEAPTGIGLVCHPHPLHQGTMDNKVVHTLARSFLALGMIAVRFNFRGVGGSEGSYGSGEGECDDAIAVADWMRAQWPGRPFYLGGFSFGAMVALATASRIGPHALVTVAPPVHRLPATFRQPDCLWLVVQGDEDELVAADGVIEWLNTLDPGPELNLLLGVDHFFHGRLTELRRIVIEFLSGDLAPGTLSEEVMDAKGTS